MNFADFIAPEDIPRMVEHAKARSRGEAAPSEFVFRGKKKDGTLIDLTATARSILWKGRDAVQNTIIDITERKQAEEALKLARDELEQRVEERTVELRASQTRFQDFAEAAADWFWEMDAELRFT